MAEDVVVYETRGWSARLTINRPERRNALNAEVVELLLGGLSRAAEDADARVVILTGVGDKAFCAGADLSGMRQADGRVDEHLRRGRLGDLLLAIVDHPKPVIARIQGLALAGGFGLAMACDLVVAAETAEFAMPEINVGLWPFRELGHFVAR